MEIVKKLVTSEDEGIRLDRWFKRHFSHYSFMDVSRMARTGQIRIDGKRVEASDRLNEGQEIRFPELKTAISAKPASNSVNNEKYRKKEYQSIIDELISSIIFMNNHVLVLNKPSGLAVQGGIGIDISIDDAMEDLKFDAKERPRLVHRIDKETSGILILARDIKTTRALAEAFSYREMSKKYLAIVKGNLPKKKGVINLPLKKINSGANFESMQPDDSGREAITHYEILKSNGDYSLILLEPITGRKHQIRAHLAALGCSVIGDRKYGGELTRGKIKFNNLYLHAYTVHFELFGEKLQFHASLPTYFVELLRSLGLEFENKVS